MTAQKEYQAQQITAAANIERLQELLKDHGKEAAQESKNYGYAGDLSHVNMLLKQAIEFLADEQE